MLNRDAPILHRNDPNKDPLIGHVKVTRQDWLNIARDVLVTDGVAEVKILGLSQRMGVSRSSFYGYFENRDDLLSALLDEWEVRNTAKIVAQCRAPARNITEAVCNFFQCFIDPSQFDRGLDFAIREWSRRDHGVRARVDVADAARLDAVISLFQGQGYGGKDAEARARILYFMQLGYHALELREPMALRMSLLVPYLRGFTGQEPDERVIETFCAFIETLGLD